MKKLALILAAVILAVSVILAGCNNTKTSNENTDANNANVPAEGIEAYYNAFEKTLEEYQTKDALDSEILATVGGIPLSASNVRYTTLLLKAPDSGYTAEEAAAETEKFYKENAALLQVAYENGIELSEKDINSIQANIEGMKLQYGEEYDQIFADSPFTKYFYYFQTSIYQALYNNLYEKVLADKESEITKSAFEEAKNSDIVRAKHILIQFPDGEGENGEMTDAQKAEVLAEANAVLAEVNAMSDISEFDALIEKYNDDPGMQSNPDGYYFGKGEMVPEFEESAFSLEEGKTSGLVETTYGYHILLKLPLEDEGIYNSGAFSNAFGTKLYESISARTADITIEYAENHDARVEDFLKEYEELMAASEEQPQE